LEVRKKARHVASFGAMKPKLKSKPKPNPKSKTTTKPNPRGKPTWIAGEFFASVSFYGAELEP